MKHGWVKLRLHHYICRKCGCGKVNFQDDDRQWRQRYHLPTGATTVLRHTPVCEVGPKSQAYLDRYSVAIAEDAEARTAAKAARRAPPSEREAHA
jgi:hypothetical protein